MMKISNQAKVIFDAILAVGGYVYIVGGSVRDMCMGIVEEHDIDVEVYGLTYQQLYDVLKQYGNVYTVGRSFAIMQVDCLNGYDFALPRTEKKIGNGHSDFDVIVDPYLPLEKSIQRRDLTMNALLYDYQTDKIIDLCHGIEDIKSKVIRCVQPEKFVEDPLRVLRIAQFVARFEMTVESKTKDLCKKMVASQMLKSLSIERTYHEYCRILMAPKPSLGFEFLKDIKALPDFLENQVSTPQRLDYHPEGNVFSHTMLVIDIAALMKYKTDQPLWFMWSCLLHDIGKPLVTTKEGHAPLHQQAGVNVFKKMNLIQSKKQRKYIEMMILHHMDLAQMARNHSRDITFLRLLKKIEGTVSLKDLMYLSCCDKLGRGRVFYDQYNDFLNYIDDLTSRLGNQAQKPLISGNDLIENDFKNYKDFCYLLNEAYDLQLQGLSRERILRSLKKKYGKG